MNQPEPSAQSSEGFGFVCCTIVSEYPPELDTYAFVVADRIDERATDTTGRFIRMDRAKGNTAVVIDGNVNILPARASPGCISAATRHPVPWTFKSTEFLNVEVQQIARGVMLVAVIRLGGLEVGKPVQSSFHQYPGYGALTQTQRERDLAVSLALAPERYNATYQICRGGMWAMLRARGATLKTGLSLFSVAA